MRTCIRAAVRLAVSTVVVIPVQGQVVRGFDPPACERCAGHRGVTVGARPGSMVVAVLAGPVEFVGEVAGRIYVVQRVAAGVRVTYGGLSQVAPGVTAGGRLGPGEAVGETPGEAYLSVRLGDLHVEPLRALGIGRARLVGPGGVQPDSVGRHGVIR